MTLDVNKFKTRTLTAIVFAAVMLCGIFINPYFFIALFSFIALGCMYEYDKLITVINRKKRFLFSSFMIFYIAFPVYCMIDLGLKKDNNILILDSLFPSSILFSIWINDTMAYIVGSFVGKTPFSKISPNKTWEGTLGGIVLCVLCISLFFSKASFFKNNFSINHWIAISSIGSIFGTLGDLFESKLKRLANVKDSGQIMPGHGGFLDRFDSLLFAAPAVWVYVKIFLH